MHILFLNNWTGFPWPGASQKYDQKQLGSLRQDILCFIITLSLQQLWFHQLHYDFISYTMVSSATLGCMPIQDTSSCRFQTALRWIKPYLHSLFTCWYRLHSLHEQLKTVKDRCQKLKFLTDTVLPGGCGQSSDANIGVTAITPRFT